MHGEPAAVATYSRRAAKEQAAGRPLEPVIDKMNQLVEHYDQTSRPAYCAQHGFVDEVVPLPELRRYLQAFTGAAYQHPASICPRHHMLLPRMIRG